MSLNELLDRSIATGKERKEKEVLDGEMVFSFMVAGYRGEELAVVMMTQNADRDMMLNGARLAAMGFGCDTITMAMDTWLTTTKINPYTGKEWAEGDMQRAVQEWYGIEEGVVRDCLMFTAVNRAGDVLMDAAAYVVKTKVNAFNIPIRKVEWTERMTPEDRTIGERGGYVVDYLRDLMNDPDLLQQAFRYVPELVEGMTPTQTRAVADCAVLKTIQEQRLFVGAIALQSDNEERSVILTKRLGRMPNTMIDDL